MTDIPFSIMTEGKKDGRAGTITGRTIYLDPYTEKRSAGE